MGKPRLSLPNLEFDGRCLESNPLDLQLSERLGGHAFSQFYSFGYSNHLCTSGSSAVQGVFGCMSKFAGALFSWFSAGLKSHVFRKLSGGNPHGSSGGNVPGVYFGSRSSIRHAFFELSSIEVAGSTRKHLCGEAQALPLLCLAAGVIPPFDNFSSRALSESIRIEVGDKQVTCCKDQLRLAHERRGCSTLAVSNLNWTKDAVEPKTGIKFPKILDSSPVGYVRSDQHTEVLVGTGSKSMRVFKFKTLKPYAFGLYVHPGSVCKKLGRKYASVPPTELKDNKDFFEDLLREDIDMTVRLVINFNGVKISSVRSAFEESLRNRLQKMNPNTDYHCLRAFGSFFTQDIKLPMGTTVNFRQTAEGNLLTEVEGRQIGAVRSKDLCKAFFDMYIGDGPISVEAKEEIAQNVARLIRRC